MEETRLPAERELESILGLEENAECHEAENEEPAGMGCSCRNLDSLFIQAIENYISESVSDLGERSPLLQELRNKLAALANGCGYERLFAGNWVQWPKQEALLNKLGSFTIFKEHDDGDLTIQTSEGKAVVTTEGEVFYEKK